MVFLHGKGLEQMLSIKPAKSLHGKMDLPPSPDLFLLAAIVALACRRNIRIKSYADSPLIKTWLDILKDHATIEYVETSVIISPLKDEASAFIVLPYYILPYRDVIIYTLLSMGKVVAFKSIGTKRLEQIVKRAKKFGFIVEVKQYGDNPGLSLISTPDSINQTIAISDEDVAPLCGLLLGHRKNAQFQVDFHFAHPLRNLAPLFGFDISLKSTVVKESDPMARRIKMMQQKKKTTQTSGQQFQLVINCNSLQTEKNDLLEITLPGDEVLGSMMVAAKCLLPKGSFVINNLPLETWATPVISFLKKMGCKISAQETTRTSFGSIGMFSIQKCELFGRKVECRPAQSYLPYLPSMVVLASFAQSQSVFRDLEDLRYDDPDGIDTIEQCIRAIGARHGEMPDGIVMEGGKEFDGFDIPQHYPSWLSGSLVIAGLKCLGNTTIGDELLLQRWPGLESLLQGICEFRAEK
jgi:hypothetical protein